MLKRTKIGATIGPACSSEAILTKMVEAGMDFARLNFSHGTHEEHAALIAAIRAVEQKTGKSLAIMQDLQGPKMRLGSLPEKGVEVKERETIQFDTTTTSYENKIFPITFPGLEEHLAAHQHILIDDGRVEVIIVAISGTRIEATVLQGGLLQSHKGLNFPDSTLTAIPALSEKDILDVAFGIKMGVDCISLSFVKTAEDIQHLRRIIAKAQHDQGVVSEVPLTIIAKIERPEAVNNLAEIIEVVDVVMVARGDLGLEMPGAMLAITQKNIVRAARLAGKPVMVATQLLDSMQHSRRPTRAEYSDVANTVIDHTDSLLLTNETAAGEFPVETVQTMADIIVATEQSSYDDVLLSARAAEALEPTLARLVQLVGSTERVRAIAVESEALGLVPRVSKLRLEIPVVVAVPTRAVARQMVWYWGVLPVILVKKTLATALQEHMAPILGLQPEDKAVVALVANTTEMPYTITTNP